MLPAASVVWIGIMNMDRETGKETVDARFYQRKAPQLWGSVVQKHCRDYKGITKDSCKENRVTSY